MDSVKVAVRVRPFNRREMTMHSKLVVQMIGKQTRLLKRSRDAMGTNHTTSNYNHNNNNTNNDASNKGSNNNNNNVMAKRDKDFHDFTYDHSYWSFDPNDPTFVNQQQVYDDLGQDVLNCAFQGYNACVFAYGQTGSGKTYTMMGSSDDPGLIPRTCESLFKRIQSSQESYIKYQTTVSYLEIYNEKVRDLLDTTHGNNLKIMSSNSNGNYVENLSHHTVTCYDEIQTYIKKGNRLRTTASTNMNDTSSRSHAILTISFTQARFANDMPSETQSKIHLVDLAGSESAGTTGATGQRLKEGAHINQSLVTLGIVINKLAEKRPGVYIAYRDSALTRILKDSLGGNSKTIMIATISPADCNVTETLSTLRYANRAKNIMNTPTVNEDSNVRLIRNLREEIQRLKALLTGTDSVRKPSEKEVANLKSLELKEKVLTSEWTEKWSAIQSILNEQKDLGLRKCGTGVMLESNGPHLIGIEEHTTNGVMLYSLSEGRTIIGNGASLLNQNSDDTENNNRPMIVVVGDDIIEEHCVIYLEDGEVLVEPNENGACEVNGVPVVEPTPLSAGSFLQLGTSNMFRYNNPCAPSHTRRQNHGMNASLMSMSQTSHSSPPSRKNNSIFDISDDEIIVVDDNKMRDLMSAHSLSTFDLTSLKKLNARERELLDQKETAILEKSQLESLLEPGEHSEQLEQLTDQIKCLEMHHCLLIRTRRKFEDEALNLSRINRRSRGFEPMTQSMNQLETIPDRPSDICPTSSSMYNVNDPVPSILITQPPKTANSVPETTTFDATCVSLSDMPTCCAMQSLHQRIAIEKAKLMKNLEDVNCDKRLVDEGIVRMNSLQRQYIAIEKELEYDGTNSQICQWHRDHEIMSSSTSDKSRVGSNSTSNHSSSTGCEYSISIPRYELRGSGNTAYYVYEISINLDTEKWTIFRRYSRIREMHLTMKRRYGDEVANIKFPRRQLIFSQTEAVAMQRQKQLETYLRRLLVVCSKIPSSPIYESETAAMENTLRKSALIEFSSFFMRGVCECGQLSENEDSIR